MSFSIASFFVNNSFVSFKLYHEIQVNKMIFIRIYNISRSNHRYANWQKWAKNTGHQPGGKFQSVLFTVVEPTCCTTQKYRLLYTIKYGTIQPMMKSGISFCAYAKNRSFHKLRSHTDDSGDNHFLQLRDFVPYQSLTLLRQHGINLILNNSHNTFFLNCTLSTINPAVSYNPIAPGLSASA